MDQDLLLQLLYHFLLWSHVHRFSKSCILTAIKQTYWLIVGMDSSSQSQNTQQRLPRAKRLDYHALNTATDSPRSRSRRGLEVNQTRAVHVLPILTMRYRRRYDISIPNVRRLPFDDVYCQTFCRYRIGEADVRRYRQIGR
ncbi:hypothetical protein V1519DRAFT_454892 [Lipomyces tetrasporus]